MTQYFKVEIEEPKQFPGSLIFKTDNGGIDTWIDEDSGTTLLIETISVTEEHQRAGQGSAMIKALIEEAHARKLATIKANDITQEGEALLKKFFAPEFFDYDKDGNLGLSYPIDYTNI